MAARRWARCGMRHCGGACFVGGHARWTLVLMLPLLLRLLGCGACTPRSCSILPHVLAPPPRHRCSPHLLAPPTHPSATHQAINVTGPGGANPEGAPRRQFDDYGGGGCVHMTCSLMMEGWWRAFGA